MKGDMRRTLPSLLAYLLDDGAHVELHVSPDPMQGCSCIVSDAPWITTYPRNQVFRGKTILVAVIMAAGVKQVITSQKE